MSIFFSANRNDRAEALALCRSCPVATACIDYATRNGEIGVWGGTNQGHREVARWAASKATPEDPAASRQRRSSQLQQPERSGGVRR